MPSPEVSTRPTLSVDGRARLGREVRSVGAAAGLAAVGIGGAGVFSATRDVLESRRRDGFAADMQFTYRNPRRSTDPERVLPGARSLVVGAWGYRRREEDERSGGRPTGRVARYARGDPYAPLRTALGRIADHLESEGFRARVVADDNALVDRVAAHRAGLGWFGRNSLLLLPGLGSWFVLGSVVTDAPLDPTPPAGPSGHAEGCGTCRRCVTACPTGALVADGVVDARRCLAWLVQAPGTFPVEFRAALGDRIYGCDDCQQVCPINRTADRRHPPAAPDIGSVAGIDLLDLLGATDTALLEAHGRWYIAERDPRHLRRNALVALGNVGDGADPATTAVLTDYIDGPDELLAEHARWAACRLGRADLVHGTGDVTPEAVGTSEGGP